MTQQEYINNKEYHKKPIRGFISVTKYDNTKISVHFNDVYFIEDTAYFMEDSLIETREEILELMRSLVVPEHLKTSHL